jgi:hypothetical protein
MVYSLKTVPEKYKKNWRKSVLENMQLRTLNTKGITDEVADAIVISVVVMKQLNEAISASPTEPLQVKPEDMGFAKKVTPIFCRLLGALGDLHTGTSTTIKIQAKINVAVKMLQHAKPDELRRQWLTTTLATEIIDGIIGVGVLNRQDIYGIVDFADCTILSHQIISTKKQPNQKQPKTNVSTNKY